MTPASRLASIAALLAAVLVPLAYLPNLEAPFVVPKFAALELAAALGLLAFALQLGSAGAVRWDRPVAVGAGLVLATTLVAWAVAAFGPHGTAYAVPALARWGALFGLAAGTSVLAGEGAARGRLLEAIAGAAAVVSAIGLFQHLELARLPIPVISAPGSTFGNRNLAAEAVAMSLPLGVAGLAGAARPAAPRALAVGLMLSLIYLAVTRARGAWLGAALGGLTMLALGRPRLGRRALAIGGAALLVALIAAMLPGRLNPLYVGDSKRFASGADVVQASFDPQSTALRTRLGIWRRGLALWRDHLLWGVGPGNWPVAFPRYAEPGATRDGVQSAWVMPRQAHDDAIERAAETGAVGLAALLVLAVAVIAAIRRRLRAAAAAGAPPEGEGEGAGAVDVHGHVHVHVDVSRARLTSDVDDARARARARESSTAPDAAAARLAIAGAAGALVALVAAGVTGFPLEMPATLALAGLALGLVAGGPARASGPPWLSQAALAGALLALLGAGLRAERQLRGNLLLGAAEREMHRDPGPAAAERALPRLARAAAITPRAYRVHLRTSQMLVRLRRFDEAAEAARRALAVEPLAANAWAALGAAELGAGHPREALASAGRAAFLLDDHAFARFIEAQAAAAVGDGNRAETSWKRLEAMSTDSAVDRDTAEAARQFLRSRHRERR